jgi:hypothetical protein
MLVIIFYIFLGNKFIFFVPVKEFKLLFYTFFKNFFKTHKFCVCVDFFIGFYISLQAKIKFYFNSSNILL